MKNAKKVVFCLMLLTLGVLLLVGCACEHDWVEATCTVPETCRLCGETARAAHGHSWSEATCGAPRTCKYCDETAGDTLEHVWEKATCLAPQTCVNCGETKGGISTAHTWKAATCSAPKTCTLCGITSGSKAQHNLPASTTCTKAGTCSYCGKSFTWTHTYKNGACSMCGKADPDAPKVYKAGEVWKVAGLFEFTIDEVYEHRLCSSIHPNYDANQPGVMVSYTYKNLGRASGLTVGWLLSAGGEISKVYDESGVAGEEYGNMAGLYCYHEISPENCSIGQKTSASKVYVLKNKSSIVRIEVEIMGPSYKSYSAIFEVPVKSDPIYSDGQSGTCTFGDTFKFELSEGMMQVTIGNDYSFENYRVDSKTETAIRIPVTLVNLGTQNMGISSLNIDIYNSNGVEDMSPYYKFDDGFDIYVKMRPGGKITGYIYIHYTGDGDYYLDFHAYLKNGVEVRLPIKK